MNKSLFSITTILVGVLGLFVAAGFVQAQSTGVPPDIEILVSVDRSPTDPYYPGDQIMVTLSLANVGADKWMRDGWRDMEFWLLLQFYDENNRLITSDKIQESTTLTPAPPRIFPDENGILIQGSLAELVENDWFVSFDPFDAHTYYPLAGRSGLIRFKAVFPGITFEPDKIEQTPAGIEYAPRDPIDTTEWFGDLQSNYASFTLVGDFDGDGYYYPLAYGATAPAVDCNDNDPTVNPGAAEIPNNGKDDNCDGIAQVVEVGTGTIWVKAVKFKLSWGSWPLITKELLVDFPVQAFDKTPGSCVSEHSTYWYQYESIWDDCEAVAFGTTGADGIVELQVPAGSYLLLGRYTISADNHIYVRRSVNDLQAGQTKKRYMWLIETARGKVYPSNFYRLTGSELIVIEPEYVEWDSSEEQYPIVFESEGDWDVKTSVDPPEGFKADEKNLKVDVNSEVKAVQFTITDVGTKWDDPTEITYEIKNKKTKKKHKIKSKVYQKLKEKKAKEEGVDIYGKKIKK